MVRSIRNAEETTPERNVAVKSFQTEYQLSKVAVAVSIGLAEHLFDEGPATFVNRTDRHLHAVKIDFLVSNKHCLGA
jgi:hypothetical protein